MNPDSDLSRGPSVKDFTLPPLSLSNPFPGNWRALRYLNLYRAILSGLIIALAYFGIAPRYFGQIDADLFWVTAVTYFAFSVACSIAIQLRWAGFSVQLFVQVLGDVVAITVMMHASGGVASGFGMLLVVAIAGGSMLTDGRVAVSLAAIATIAVLSQQIYVWLDGTYPGTSYSQAGMLGITFFATAFLGYVLAKRARASEALAERRGTDLANLATLNEHIIQRMQSGVLVLDQRDNVRLLNSSASQLLGLKGDIAGKSLAKVSPELVILHRRWRDDAVQTSHIFRPESGAVDVMASFAKLGDENAGGGGALVFLEDASAMRQRAQQLKLASLGRLTASIAHEIRNPLGAISHAGQLLTESETLPQTDRRLTRIIDENCHRMNAMVENILQLSRRTEPNRETVVLTEWARRFIDDFSYQRDMCDRELSLDSGDVEVRARVDANQLQQVVWNLCENAIRHAKPPVRVVIRVGKSQDRPYIEVLDNGEGIDPSVMEDLFEPFFTTQNNGTGLGLYIARELCEINQASLDLVEVAEVGSCFRVTFSDPRRTEAPT